MRGTRRNARPPLENNLLTLWIGLDRLVEEDHDGVITEVEAPPILRSVRSVGDSFTIMATASLPRSVKQRNAPDQRGLGTAR
jgi:hypothetical protein